MCGGLLSLPDELLLSILSLLPGSDLARLGASCHCTAWRGSSRCGRSSPGGSTACGARKERSSCTKGYSSD